jgi:hypothetical protein
VPPPTLANLAGRPSSVLPGRPALPSHHTNRPAAATAVPQKAAAPAAGRGFCCGPRNEPARAGGSRSAAWPWTLRPVTKLIE